MCGIAGWLDLNRQLDFKIFESMNNIVKYRGPDDEGYVSIGKKVFFMRGDDTCRELADEPHVHTFKDDSSFLTMGHRRLSILDLSYVGHQPMSDDGYYVVFNGEIYNYIEIKKELEGKGYNFITTSDTEVLLKAYEEWGEDSVRRFDGMWAFAIWDDKNNKLFCSRDRLGAKPFFYYLDNEQFIFGSEIKQLCQNPKVSKSINYNLLVKENILGITDYSEDTFINEIKELRGGYNISITLNPGRDRVLDFKKVKYWDLPQLNNEYKSEPSKTFQLLRDSIKIRMRSDVPVGVMLSGGLDSSCLVAGLSEFVNDMSTVSTFTSCYNNFKAGDEKNFAHLVNEYCNTKANYIYPDEKDTLSVYKDIVWHVEGMDGEGFGGIGSWLLLQDISKKGFRVLLNGQGSDEVLLGYERYYAFYLKEVLKKAGIRAFQKEYRNIVKNSGLNSKQLIEYVIYFTHPEIRRKRCLRRMENCITKKAKIEFENDHSTDYILKCNTLDEMQYNEIRNMGLTNILRLDDRCYMAFSIESRVPFIDYRFIESAIGLKLQDKIHNGYTKYSLRKSFDSELPSEVIWRRNKMGWPSPAKRWSDRFDKKQIYEMFNNPRSSNIFNVKNVREAYEKNSSSYPFYRFLTTEILLRKFIYNE